VGSALMARERRRRGRLSRSGDFDRVYREGRSHSNRYVVLYAFPRQQDAASEPADADGGRTTRLGLSVGRKVGGAVDRNKVKRCLREAFWELAERLPEGYDFVLVARPDLGSLVEREGTAGAREAIEEVIAAMPKPGGASK
jgi:ribonuclease P protein component